jgi:hypothetical protein
MKSVDNPTFNFNLPTDESKMMASQYMKDDPNYTFDESRVLPIKYLEKDTTVDGVDMALSKDFTATQQKSSLAVFLEEMQEEAKEEEQSSQDSGSAEEDVEDGEDLLAALEEEELDNLNLMITESNKEEPKGHNSV